MKKITLLLTLFMILSRVLLAPAMSALADENTYAKRGALNHSSARYMVACTAYSQGDPAQNDMDLAAKICASMGLVLKKNGVQVVPLNEAALEKIRNTPYRFLGFGPPDFTAIYSEYGFDALIAPTIMIPKKHSPLADIRVRLPNGLYEFRHAYQNESLAGFDFFKEEDRIRFAEKFFTDYTEATAENAGTRRTAASP